MSYQDSAPHPWPLQPHQVSDYDSSQSTIRQHGHYDNDSTPRQRSLSPQPTASQDRPSVPSPPSLSSSTPELYGPQRLFGHPSTPPKAYYPSRPHAEQPEPQPIVRFDETQLAMFAADNSARVAGIKDELTIAAGKVTPGVDDTPYIQYALEALTRDRGSSFEQQQQQHYPSGSSNQLSQTHQYHPSRRIPDEEMGYAQLAEPSLAHVDYQYHSDPVIGGPINHEMAEESNPAQPLPQDPIRDSQAIGSDQWVPVTRAMREHVDPYERTYPPLTYKPRILRPFSMMILMTLCLLMTAALIFTAVYSDRNSGLTSYPGSIYSGQYFVFRILPQLLAAVMLIYAQAITTTSSRVLPFAALASEDPHKRYQALFQKLFPTSFLWPQLVGPWQFKVYSVVAWLACFTIPLQSSAFTCIFVDGDWVWAPVQGVVWTLVALYLLLILATAVLMVFWFGQWTGLVWDVRSIADVIPLLNRSNATAYEHLGTAEKTSDLKDRLPGRWFDRLGYWRTGDMLIGGIWYALGSSAVDPSHHEKAAHGIIGKRISYDPSLDTKDLAVPTNLGRSRYKYLPWYLCDIPIAASVAITGILLLALLIISFLPQTRLEDGFQPLISARPGSGAFSAANFLYSFVPSLLGMLLFLLFQSLDQALRVLQPWAELARPEGAGAKRGLLADYAACLPFQSTWRAVRNGHWRVAAISLMAVLFILIPVMAGALFMALTTSAGQVRMFPSMPVFGVLLAFLFLYVGCLSLLMPRRRQFYLPRPVTTLAGIISLCAAEELTQDAAFRSVRSRRDLEGRLGAAKGDPRGESVWHLGLVPGRDEQRVSVRRLNRFTEKKRSYRSSRSMV